MGEGVQGTTSRHARCDGLVVKDAGGPCLLAPTDARRCLVLVVGVCVWLTWGACCCLWFGLTLQYTPTLRIDPLNALAHPFFDELRDPETRLPSGDALPQLFNFSQSELAPVAHLAPFLIPPHARNAENWPPGLYDGAVSGGAGASA